MFRNMQQASFKWMCHEYRKFYRSKLQRYEILLESMYYQHKYFLRLIVSMYVAEKTVNIET